MCQLPGRARAGVRLGEGCPGQDASEHPRLRDQSSSFRSLEAEPRVGPPSLSTLGRPQAPPRMCPHVSFWLPSGTAQPGGQERGAERQPGHSAHLPECGAATLGPDWSELRLAAAPALVTKGHCSVLGQRLNHSYRAREKRRMGRERGSGGVGEGAWRAGKRGVGGRTGGRAHHSHHSNDRVIHSPC